MMGFRGTLVLCSLLVVGTAGIASAQDANGDGMDDVTGQPVGGGEVNMVPATTVAPGTGQAVSVSQRPLTLPAGVLAIGDGGPWAISPVFNILRVEFCADTPVGPMCAGDTGVGLNLGASYGITDDLQIDANILPLQLSPDADYGSPRVGATYRFVRGNVDVGARAGFTLAHLGDDYKPAIDIGVPLDLHIGDNMRLSTGAFLNLTFADPDAIVGLNLPVWFNFNATPNVALGLGTGLNILTFENAGDSIVIPLQVYGMYTLADDQNRAMLDVGAMFGFPYFLTPGEIFGDTVNANLWQISLLARFHLHT